MHILRMAHPQILQLNPFSFQLQDYPQKSKCEMMLMRTGDEYHKPLMMTLFLTPKAPL